MEEDPLPSTSSARNDEVDFVSLPLPMFNRSNTKDQVSKMITKCLVDNGALGTKQQNASSKVMNHISQAKKIIPEEVVESDDLSETYLRFNRMRQEQNFFKKMSGPNFLEAIIAKPKARLPDINDEVIDEYGTGGGGENGGSNDEEERNFDGNGKPIPEAQRGTLKPGTMNTINAEFESFDYTETSSALR